MANDPAHLPTVRALAGVLLAEGQPAQARNVLANYLLDHPTCARGWKLAALLEWKLSRYDQAIGILHRALERLPHSPFLRSQLDVFLQAMGRPGQTPQSEPIGDPDYLDRIVQDPRLLEALLNLASDENDTLIFREIASRLTRLIDEQPRHADRLLQLARVHLRLGDMAAATTAVQRAVELNPNFADAQRLRATLLARAGDHDQAIAALKSLVAAGRDWPDLHVQIARCQHATGRKDQARQHLYRALNKNPRYPSAVRLLRRCAA
jgi:tetratricopeptide (TPR) repeat protein